MIVDLHNHTPRCKHAEGDIEEFVKKAIENGTQYFGFSDHAPMNFNGEFRMDISEIDEYEKDVFNLKEKYKNQIDVLLGYEVDYLEGYVLDEIVQREVDYLIGSVHFVDKWGFDNPEFIGEYKRRDLNEVWKEYFAQLEAMAKYGKFDIVGHLDLIKIFKYYPEKDIKSLAQEAVKAIKKADMVVEINLAGYRKPVNEQYPSKEILELIFESDIPITFGSDGHRLSEIGLNSAKGVALAKEIGFTKCAVFKNRERKLINF